MTFRFMVPIVVSTALASLACSSKRHEPETRLAEYDPTGRTPKEIARYIFDNYRCKTCHTLDAEKFGYTARGEKIREQGYGCVALLTSMNVIAQVKESDRTEEHKLKASHFNDYGCSICHKIEPGAMGLTKVGGRLAGLHMGCVEVKGILNRRAGSATP